MTTLDDIMSPRTDVCWVALIQPDGGYYVTAEWRRGEPAPLLANYLGDVRAVRARVAATAAAAAADGGSVEAFHTRAADGRWLGIVSVLEPAWLPQYAYGGTQ